MSTSGFLTIVWTSAGEIRRGAFDKPTDEGEANAKAHRRGEIEIGYCRVRRWIDADHNVRPVRMLYEVGCQNVDMKLVCLDQGIFSC